ncbi:MAG: Tol-Pal system protein TolB, partial [Candidatus Schmidhempelia sp.]|nr:Tol-Pal system protein TolB [Candidatus Schmidhempelia sp.]
MFFSISFFGHTEVQIVITDGIDSAKPIAVVPFKWNGTGKVPQKIEDIIASDLRNSGKFNPISINKMPENPENTSEIKAKSWTALGIDAVVIGKIEPSNDGQYLVSYQLVDTINTPGAILAENQYSVTERWLRYAAHTASDEIFQSLTGIKGAFRTRIAYVVKTNSGNFSHELRVADYDGY